MLGQLVQHHALVVIAQESEVALEKENAEDHTNKKKDATMALVLTSSSGVTGERVVLHVVQESKPVTGDAHQLVKGALVHPKKKEIATPDVAQSWASGLPTVTAQFLAATVRRHAPGHVPTMEIMVATL